MIDLRDEAQQVYHAFLIGIAENDQDSGNLRDELDELAELVRNIDLVPLAPEIIRNHGNHAQYRVGSGKALEVAQLVQECEADVVIFDVSLTPTQQRNWERLVKCPVIDREEVIIDIFAGRAHTHEAVLQVELARAKYNLPRLTHAWSHFSRQRGGGNTTRGAGEAQIETDRRLLRKRIQQLNSEIALVRRQRDTRRKSRQRRPVLQGAIVGYTNVGKSSLLQELSGSEILVKDQLFATLDPTARKIQLGNNLDLVLTDTVGFVRNLPHSLIEAFKSTLEEAVLADFLLLVLDISSPQIEAEWETTLSVLKEIGAEEKKIQIIFNKIDLIDRQEEALKLARIRALFPEALYISTRTGEGLEQLQERLKGFASESHRMLEVLLPPQRSDLAALAHAVGQVYESEYQADGTLRLLFSADQKVHHKFQEFLLK